MEDEVLSEMVKEVVRAIDPEGIILFGSRARGDHREDSDIDLMIVEREPFGPERSRLAEISRVRRTLSRFGFAKDILVYSSDEMRKWSRSPNHVIYSGLTEGKVLYERS